MRVILCVLMFVISCHANKYMDIDSKIQEIMELIRRNEIATTTGKDCGKTADIAFILDCSSSIKENDYNTMKNFIKNIIKSFEVGQDKTRVAIISFNQFVSVDLYLDQSTDVDAAVKAVDDILATKTGTNTHKALAAARTMVFQPSVGDRPKAANIAIVLTDGRSTFEEETRKEAQNLKIHGVNVFSIGVGQWLSDQELQVIATRPASIFSYRLETFDGLETIRENLQEKTCITAGKNPDPMPECDEPRFDIAFILDASSSIPSEGFQQMKNFVDSFLSSFEISPSATRAAVITYNLYTDVAFNFEDFDSYSPIKAAIHGLEQRSTGTATNKALELARTDVFSVKREGPTAKKFAVLLTDGKSLWPEKTKEEAEKLRQSGVTVFAVGIGKVKVEELENVASKPASEYNIQVEKYEDLKDKLTDMVKTTCKGKGKPDSSEGSDEEKPDKTPEDCAVSGPADLMFLVQIPKDDSEYEIMLKYMTDIINRLDIDQEKLRVAVTLFAKNPFPVVTLPEAASKEGITSALNDFELPQKRRAEVPNAFSVLDVMSDLGWRRQMPRILVTVLIDGPEKSLMPDLLETFEGIKRKNLESIVVNVGKPWEEGVMTLADDKKDAIFVPRFDALRNAVEIVAARICDATDVE